MRKILLVLVGCFIGMLIAGLIGAGALYWASQQKPTFYNEALAVPVQKQREASDQLLAQAAALKSTVRREGDWELLVGADQINGWLAVDLVENHPDALPKEIRSPRVAFKPHEVLLGWTFERGGLETVCSLRASVSLAEPNVLAVTLHGAYAGSVPLPLGQILDMVRDRVRDAKIQLQWKQSSDGEPVALITLPSADDDGLLRRLDALEVQDGKVYLKGGVETESQAAARRRAAGAKTSAKPSGKSAFDETSPSAANAIASANDRATHNDGRSQNDGAPLEVEDERDDAPLTARSQVVGAAAAAKARRSQTGGSGVTYRMF